MGFHIDIAAAPDHRVPVASVDPGFHLTINKRQCHGSRYRNGSAGKTDRHSGNSAETHISVDIDVSLGLHVSMGKCPDLRRRVKIRYIDRDAHGTAACGEA